MNDLVQKVARAIFDESGWGESEPEGFEDAARAAIAAVYDDLAEPTEAEWNQYQESHPLIGHPNRINDPVAQDRHSKYLRLAFEVDRAAMLAAKRREVLGDE